MEISLKNTISPERLKTIASSKHSERNRTCERVEPFKYLVDVSYMLNGKIFRRVKLTPG